MPNRWMACPLPTLDRRGNFIDFKCDVVPITRRAPSGLDARVHRFSIGVALLAEVAIIAIGFMHLLIPRAATLSFGLPLPEDGPNIAWWLRLKGTRDAVSCWPCWSWATPARSASSC